MLRAFVARTERLSTEPAKLLVSHAHHPFKINFVSYPTVQRSDDT